MKRLLLSIVVLSIGLLSAVNILVNIPGDNKADYVNAGRDIACFKPDGSIDIVIDETELTDFKAQYPQMSVVTTDEELRNNFRKKTRDLPGYRDYGMLTQELYNLQLAHANICMLTSIGESWGKIQFDLGNFDYYDYQHDLYAIKVSDNPGIEEDEPVIYFVGEHHAREPISLEVVMNLLNHLLENYYTDPQIQDYVDNYQIWFIPLLNPDGHKIVTDEGDMWWRKNIRDHNYNNEVDFPSSYGNTFDGVDLNRNYGWHWGNHNAPDDMNDATYHGTGPFSEPETQAFRDFLEEHKPVAGLSYHSYGNYVLFPFGYGWNAETADREVMVNLADEMAQRIHRVNGLPYQSFVEWQLYPCMGGTDDYAYGMHRTIAFTIELADTFIPDASLVQGICDENLNGQLHFLDRFEKSILKGHVTDSVSGEPIGATIFIDGIDNLGSGQTDYMCNPQWGSYYRTLQPGDYTFEVSANGYITQRDIPFTITDSTETVIDIQLELHENSTLTIEVVDDNNEPMPETAIQLVSLVTETYTTAENGTVTILDVPVGMYNVRIDCPGYGLIDKMLEVGAGDTFWHVNLYPHSLIFDFEIDSNGWNCSGAWGTTNDNSLNGVQSLSSKYPGYSMSTGSYAKLIQPLDNSEGDVSIEFFLTSDYQHGDNNSYFQISEDQTTWITLESFRENSDWTKYSYDLSQYNWETMYIRFFQYMETGTSGGVYVDDFAIYQNQVTVPNDENNQQIPVVKSLVAYPNPFSNELIIETKGLSDEKVQIYNIKGQLVNEIESSKGKAVWNTKLDNGQAAGNGIYFIKCGNIKQKTLLLK